MEAHDTKEMVDELVRIKDAMTQLKDKESELKVELTEYAQSMDVDVIDGSEKQCRVSEVEKIIFPQNKDELVELVKKKGLYDEVAMVNYARFTSKIKKGEIKDDEVLGLIKKEKVYSLRLQNIK